MPHTDPGGTGESPPTPAERFDEVLDTLGALLEDGKQDAALQLMQRELGINARPIVDQLKELQIRVRLLLYCCCIAL